MPLVTSESLGYLSINDADIEASLVIPVTAPLVTGKRAVVYVTVPGKPGTFAGRDVVLGPRAGDYYLVKEGLQEGESVVTNGNFKIDSAIQILAKPSMMNPEGGISSTGHEQHGSEQTALKEVSRDDILEIYTVSDIFQKQILDLLTSYYLIHYALSRDDYKKSISASESFIKNLEAVNMKLLSGNAHMSWMKHREKLESQIKNISQAKDINSVRTFFDDLSDEFYTLVKSFVKIGKDPVYRLFCPMANDNKGAYWIQKSKDVQNPYFGSMMFKCGSVKETVYPGNAASNQEVK
jgi:Cu(I)/Ag(I) efflux system membrane fusion protein